MGDCGRDRRNDDGRRLVEFAANGRFSILDTFFFASKLGISHMSKRPSHGNGEYRLECILTRQAHRRLERNVSVRRVDLKGSDYNLVLASVRLLGRVILAGEGQTAAAAVSPPTST